MDTRTLLYSRLDALAKRTRGSLDDAFRDEAEHICTSIVSRELDAELLADICQYWRNSATEAGDLSKLADIVAVLIEPETEPDEPLPPAVYGDLADILNEHADTMDLDQLTAILNAVLAKGGI